MHTLRNPLILMVALVGGACGDDITAEAGSPVGCYNLALGTWDHPPEEQVIALPDRIILTDERGTDVLENDRLLVRPYPEFSLQSYRWSWWEPLENDSIRIAWTTGFSGVEMTLGRNGDDFRGHARNFLDYPIEVSTANVTLDRFTCS